MAYLGIKTKLCPAAFRECKNLQNGKPPIGITNFTSVQHFIYQLATTRLAGLVLVNNSISSNQASEGEIRKAIIETELVSCMLALPDNPFHSAQAYLLL
ncbi:MAG: SAM-dependent methyltransferase [Nitrospirota bacterium]|nr:SAM-dependent methyltransferase [Nitrospirota bacterium]